MFKSIINIIICVSVLLSSSFHNYLHANEYSIDTTSNHHETALSDFHTLEHQMDAILMEDDEVFESKDHEAKLLPVKELFITVLHSIHSQHCIVTHSPNCHKVAFFQFASQDVSLNQAFKKYSI